MKQRVDQNAIRRGIALAIPVVLDALASGKNRAELDAINSFLPKYQLMGLADESIQPYFTVVNLKDTGKRRVYMNGNGYFIRYLTRKSVRAIFADLNKERTEKIDEQIFNDCFANRWVIIKGSSYKSLRTFNDFIDAIAYIEVTVSKGNHPPCGYGKYTCISDIIDHGNLTNLRPDFMQPGPRSVLVKLERYVLDLPKIGDQNHDKSI